MLTNTRTPGIQHIYSQDFSKRSFRPEPYAYNDGHFVGEDGFVVPKNFQEFSERYPNHVERWVRAHCKGAAFEDMQDWSQDLLMHLSSLPPMSKFRKAGKEDVIETFDPARHFGANQRRFLNFVNLCLTNKLRSLFSKSRKNPLTRRSNLRLWVEDDSRTNGVIGDEYCHFRSPELRYAADLQSKQASDRHFFAEFTDFIQERGEQELVTLMQAIAATRNGAEAIEMMGTSPRSMTRMHRRLRTLGECFVSGAPVPRQRKLYKARTTQST
jgi:hypothetical protein